MYLSDEQYRSKNGVENNAQLKTIKKAALTIGVEYRQLLEAVKSNLIPHYKIGRSRKLVDIIEVIAVMKNDGGCHES